MLDDIYAIQHLRASWARQCLRYAEQLLILLDAISRPYHAQGFENGICTNHLLVNPLQLLHKSVVKLQTH